MGLEKSKHLLLCHELCLHRFLSANNIQRLVNDKSATNSSFPDGFPEKKFTAKNRLYGFSNAKCSRRQTLDVNQEN